MNYYKTQELSIQYKVSPRTITRWTEWANSSKIKLELINIGKRSYILNTPANHTVMQQLVSKNMKFKNKRKLHVISPREEFYKVFKESHIIDIVSNIESNREIPHKYTYFNRGADYWDNYINSGLDVLLTLP